MMNETIKTKAQELYPIESHANEHTAFLQGARFLQEEIDRDIHGFLSKHFPCKAIKYKINGHKIEIKNE